MAIPYKFRDDVAVGAKAAGLVGVPGAFSFGADVPFLIGIWTLGALSIADKADQPVGSQELKAVAASTISGISVFLAGSKIANSLFHLLPGPGTLAAIGINSGLNAFFTYRFLREVAKIFDKYDDEEMIHRALTSMTGMFGILTIPSDIAEMMEILTEADTSAAEDFKRRARDI